MKNFFKKKKILITGHTGFKGSWLSLWLSHLDSNLLGVSNTNFKNSSHFKKLKLKLTSKYADIRDKKKISKIIWDFKPDIIFHLAAQSLVKQGYKKPSMTIEVNVKGTYNVLESASRLKKKVAIINVTSDKCYKNDVNKKTFIESDQLGGDDPYSFSKSMSELLTSYFQKKLKSKKIFIASARCGNVIGGGDWSDDRIIPDIVKSITKNKLIYIRNYNSVRPWIHVLDSIRGYLMLAKMVYLNPKYCGAYNFSPQSIKRNYEVKDIINLFSEEWSKVQHKRIKTSFFEHNYLKLNSNKAKKIIGWTPIYSTNNAIKKTIEWYKENNKKNLSISKKQLLEFLKK